MAQGPFPISFFQLANGLAVAGGHVIVNLSKDVTATTGPIAAGLKVSLTLDESGAIIGSPMFWPNRELDPDDSYYIYQVYNIDGQPITGPLYLALNSSGFGFGESFGTSFGS